MIKSLIALTLIISCSYSFAFCKINQYGHNLCTGEKALLVTSSVKKSLFGKDENLTSIYKPVVIKILHVHEPVAVISGPGVRKQKVHIDQILGNKLCDDSKFCHNQKVTINEECRAKLDDPKKEYKVDTVYEDQEFLENIVEVKRGLILKESKILNESCLTISSK